METRPQELLESRLARRGIARESKIAKGVKAMIGGRRMRWLRKGPEQAPEALEERAPQKAGAETGPPMVPPVEKAPSGPNMGKMGKILEMVRLERRGWELSLLAILMIVVLQLFIVVSYLGELGGAPRDMFREFVAVHHYIIGSAILILLLCGYLYAKNREISRLREEFYLQRIELEDKTQDLEEVRAFFEISTIIAHKKDLKAILDIIVRESLRCLKADRSTVYLLEGDRGVLKSQAAYASNPLYEQVNGAEEKKVAQKVLKQNHAVLLREAEDFAEFFKNEPEARRIKSLMGIPLLSEGRALGVLSMASMTDGKFDAERLKLLSIFGNHASIAIENTNLVKEVHRGRDRRSKNESLDSLLNLLRDLSQREKREVEDFIKGLKPWAPGNEEFATARGEARGAEGELGDSLRVNFENDFSAQCIYLSEAGAFIRTKNPFDLEEHFPLKLNLPDGGQPVEVTCKVIWSNKYGKESEEMPRGMSVKFLQLSPENQSRIKEFIRSQKTKSPL